MDQALASSWRLYLNGQRSRASGLTILVFDLLLTFNEEREFFWRTRFTWTTFLFLWTRYISISVIVFGLFANSTPFMSDALCTWWIRIEAAIGVSLALTTQSIIQLRIFALYERSKKIAAIMGTAFFLELSGLVVIFFLLTRHFTGTAEHLENLSRCKVHNVPTYSYVFWICILGLEFLLCSLSLFKVWQYFTTPRLTRPSDGLHRVILRDSAMYTCLTVTIWTINLHLWVYSLPDGLDSASGLALALPSIMALRMMINVREAYSKNVFGGTNNDVRLDLISIPMFAPDPDRRTAQHTTLPIQS